MGCSSHRHDHLHPLAPLLLVVVLVTARTASAQSPSGNSNNNSNNYNPYLANANFNPSMAIVIVALICAFFFLGFFSIYIRHCAGDRRDTSVTARSARAAAAGRSRRPRGLDPEILASFPTLVYSDVRAHKIGKGYLECAVCLSEFEDDDTLRLLPKCDHVFHPDCIDAWLAAHVTCPVCRSNLDEPAGPDGIPAEPPAQEPEPGPTPVRVQEDEHQVVIEMRPEENAEEERIRMAEMGNLERFVNMKRARSRARPANFPRSHSTGHSLVLPGENLDRFTLRLPENIRRDLVQRAEMMKRTKSLVAFPTEGSSRREYRGGEGSTGKGRSIRLGRSDRWGSSLLRTLSTKMPNWGRRGDGGDGSTSMRGGGGIFRRGDSIKGEGSTRGVRFNAVVSPFDCYGSGAGAKEEDSQSSTAALNRV